MRVQCRVPSLQPARLHCNPFAVTLFDFLLLVCFSVRPATERGLFRWVLGRELMNAMSPLGLAANRRSVVPGDWHPTEHVAVGLHMANARERQVSRSEEHTSELQ